MLDIELQEEEEFEEADILWPDAEQVLDFSTDDDDDDDDRYFSEHRQMKLQMRQKASSPIDIPGRKGAAGGATGAEGVTAQAVFRKFGASRAGSDGGSALLGSHVFVPPHVVADRRAKRDKAMLMPSGRTRMRKMRE